MADKFCLRASRRSIRPNRQNRPVSFPSYRAGKPISDTQLPLGRIKETGIAVIAHSLRRTFLKVGASARVSVVYLKNPSLSVEEKVSDQADPESVRFVACKLAWPALLRKLDRLDPSYRE